MMTDRQIGVEIMKLAINYIRSGNIAMARRYLEINGYRRIEVGKHHLGERGFQAWLMNGQTTGSATSYRFKRDAMADAREISDALGIPIETI
jgi:hypothetical protein